jgi:ribonucleotide reductase alpha subunit
MRTHPIAYEKYLVTQTNKILEQNPTMTSSIEIIAAMLYEDCKKQNPLSFDIVTEVSESGWTFETFESAAQNVLDRVNKTV